MDEIATHAFGMLAMTGYEKKVSFLIVCKHFRNIMNAIIVFNLGSPDKPENIEPFLYNLFSDSKIFRMPGGSLLSKPLAKIIAKIRKKTAAQFYKSVGGVSPLLKITEAQASALELMLQKDFPSKVYVAMRYWHPLIEDIIDEIIAKNYTEIILVPLYPHYSEATTGSFFERFYEIAHQKKLDTSKVSYVKSYPTNGNYITAMADKLRETIKLNNIILSDNVALIFSAHSLPKFMVKHNDPYPQQINETFEALESKIAHYLSAALPVALAFQSRMRPFQWLKPAITDVVRGLAKQGIKTVMVLPVSFVADNIETVYELGVTVKEEALKAGIQNYYLVECINDNKKFIRCLYDVVVKEMRGRDIVR